LEVARLTASKESVGIGAFEVRTRGADAACGIGSVGRILHFIGEPAMEIPLTPGDPMPIVDSLMLAWRCKLEGMPEGRAAGAMIPPKVSRRLGLVRERGEVTMSDSRRGEVTCFDLAGLSVPNELRSSFNGREASLVEGAGVLVWSKKGPLIAVAI